MNGVLTGGQEPVFQGTLRELMQGRTARVLDLGFGEGRAMLELAWEFRDEHGANTFDLIYSAAVIRLAHDKASVLEDVCRVLRPGGVALLDVDDSSTGYPVGLVSQDALNAT